RGPASNAHDAGRTHLQLAGVHCRQPKPLNGKGVAGLEDGNPSLPACERRNHRSAEGHRGRTAFSQILEAGHEDPAAAFSLGFRVEAWGDELQYQVSGPALQHREARRRGIAVAVTRRRGAAVSILGAGPSRLSGIVVVPVHLAYRAGPGGGAHRPMPLRAPPRLNILELVIEG